MSIAVTTNLPEQLPSILKVNTLPNVAISKPFEKSFKQIVFKEY